MHFEDTIAESEMNIVTLFIGLYTYTTIYLLQTLGWNWLCASATEVLSIDVEIITVTISKHFYISTVTVNKLNQFWVDVKYKKIFRLFQKHDFLNLISANK